jgi:peptidoglycan/LPS O-acetylase OafA/YrhL
VTGLSRERTREETAAASLEPRRLPSLDGLRAGSILLVMVGHLAFATGFRTAITDQYARAGVLIFFVISGYLITSLMQAEIDRTGRLSVVRFYTRRAWRILPVFYAYLATVTWFQYAEFTSRELWLSWTHLASLAAWFGNPPWALSHLWSLSVEELFYLGWPLVVVLGLRSARTVAWVAVFTAPVARYLSAHSDLDGIGFSLPGVVDSIATGCLLAFYAERLKRLVAGPMMWLVWPVALLLPLLARIGSATTWLWPVPQLVGHAIWPTFNALVAVGILWAVNRPPHVLNHPVPVWIGRLSYSLYLWHMPWMNPALSLGVAARICLAFTCAIASYYLLERPLLARRDSRIRESRKPRPLEAERWVGLASNG